MVNRGKQFEEKFKNDWLKTMNSQFFFRLPDQMSGYKYYSSNICDFLSYCNGKLYLIECKSIKGNTFPLGNLTQYDKLKYKVGIPGIRAGVVIWFYERDKVIYVPISTITKMKQDGKKSVNITKLEDYKVIDIPSIKKRVFLDSDYSILKDLQDGE